MKRPKRILWLSDTQAGHGMTLTPPDWFSTVYKNTRGSYNAKRTKWGKYQRELWAWFKKTIEALRPIDILFHTGELIDGPRNKRECITTDLQEQAEIAIAINEFVDAKKEFYTYASGYHVEDVGKDTNVEDFVAAERGNAVVDSTLLVDVNGYKFDLKHKVGASSVPYGKATPVLKEMVWNMLYEKAGIMPEVDCVLRGHTHSSVVVYDPMYNTWGFVGAGTQWGSKFGRENINRLITLGMYNFDITEKGEMSWQPHMVKLEAQKIKVLKA